MARRDFIGVRADPRLRQTLRRFAQEQGLIYRGEPNISEALRQAVTRGVEVLQETNERHDEED